MAPINTKNAISVLEKLLKQVIDHRAEIEARRMELNARDVVYHLIDERVNEGLIQVDGEKSNLRMWEFKKCQWIIYSTTSQELYLLTLDYENGKLAYQEFT